MGTDLSSISKISRIFVGALVWLTAVFAPPAPAVAQDVSARFLADYGNVTVMEVTGNFDQNTPEGHPNVAPRQAIAKEFFRTHKDEYDFITIFTNFDVTMRPDAIAFYNHIKNDVGGIGQQIYDNSALYGSNGKLQGTIDMGNLLKLTTTPLDPHYDITVDTMMHETLHRWSAFVKFRDWNGGTSDALLGSDKAHWSFLFDSGGSTLYGNKWRDNGNGTFTSTAVRKYYSSQDLYLMGMLDKSKVPPTLLIDNPAIDPTQPSELGATISGIARTVTVDDIIAVEGERSPSFKDSQKQFKTAFIYVVTPGSFTPDDLIGIENLRNGYLARFSILTDGQGVVQVASTPQDNLPANPGVHPSATMPRTLPPNINDGLSWLVNHQQSDGSWTDFALTTERDTAESVATLQLFPAAQSQFRSGLDWLGANGSTTTDYLARRIEARVHAGADSTSLVQELLTRRNSDGGWGGGRNFISSPTDTAQALKALAAAGYGDQTVTGQAIAYLQATQNLDGGWSGETITSIIQPTAAVLSAYTTYRKSHDLEIGISKAVAYLTSKQNSDGGFGNSPSTVYDSSLALMALQSLNADKARINNGMNYLLGQQGENGSWNESPLQTALSMRAVWQASVEPDLSIKAEDITIIPGTITALPTNAVLSATIQNLGNTDVPQAKISLYEGSIDPEHKLADQTLAFPGQSSVTVTFPIPVTSATGHVYYVAVDPDNLIKETNKGNNRASKSMLPEITYDFQVLSSDISVMPDPVDAGKDVKIAFKLSNRGTSDAYNVPVRLFIDQAGSPVEISQLTVDMPAGGSVAKEVIWKAGLAGVNLPLTLQIDPNNTFKETSKDNNKASVMLTVNASTLPNLSVSYKDMIVSPSHAREGGSASISVLVKNDGFSAVENVKVNIFKGLAANEGTLLSSQVISVIPVGQAVRVATEWQGIAENGERIISVQVDPDNIIQEIGKDDNFTFTTLDILNLPDLAISDSSIVINPATPKSGDPVSVSVTVQNAGDQEARNVTVLLKEGEAVVGSTVIPLINGNSQSSSAIIYSNSAQTGKHRVSIIIDPDNTLVESTKENNSAAKNFSIQNANLWLSEAYISPNGDGIKDSTDFFFRLAVAAKVTVQVVNKKNVVVRTFSGGELDNTTGTTITWNGKNDAGTVVDDGTYQIKVMGANTVLLASLPVEVDTNRLPLADALGTKYLLQSNQTCMLPNYSNLQWLPDESGLTFTLSPDANSSYWDGIYRMSPAGEEVLRLVPDLWNSISDPNISYNFYTHDLSPDGQRIVFDQAKTTRTVLGNVYSHSLWMVNTDGGNLMQLTEERQTSNSDGNAYKALKWSPDGKRIAVVDASGLSVINPETKFVSAPLSGGNDNYSDFPAWSQDGTQLVAIFNNPFRIALLDADGNGGMVSVGANFTYGSAIGWMSGNKILVSAYDNNAYSQKALLFKPADSSIININLDSIDYTTISSDGRYAEKREYGWSDGIAKITVIDSMGNVSVIAEYPLNENAPTVGDGESVNVIGARVWSGDNNRLAYVNTHYDETNGRYYDDIVIYDAETGNSRRIEVSNYSVDPDADWNDYPDGMITQIIWMKDQLHFLVTTHGGTFLLNLNDGSRSEFLPIGTANFLNFSPTERYLTFEQYNDANSGCYSKWGNQWVMSSLLNLTADLRIAKSKTFVTLRGIASDKYFEGYRLEYSDVKTPGNWNLVTPPSDVPVLNGPFTTWVPPYEGSFFVRLIVWDKAGNQAVDRKRLNWGMSSLITNLYKTEEFISPNSDGIKDAVELHYQVLEPVHLEFNVYDSGNNLVRTFSRNYTDPANDFITWDGKDNVGRVVSDGQYRISVFDYDFFVKVDTTFPNVLIAFDPLQIFTIDRLNHAKVVLHGRSQDQNIKKWEVEYADGANPQNWVKLREGNKELISVDEQGTQRDDLIQSHQDLLIGEYKGKRYRITAEDFAGNRSSLTSDYVEERIMLMFWDEFDVIGARMFAQSMMAHGVHALSGIDTVRFPTARRVLQYTSAGQWFDSAARETASNEGYYRMSWDTALLDVSSVDALRMKIEDVYGGEHFSAEIAVEKREYFYAKVACDQSIEVHHEKPESLGTLTLQISDDKGVTWKDASRFTYINQSVVNSVFQVPLPLYDVSRYGQYLVRVVANSVDGTVYYTAQESFPRRSCDKVSVKMQVSYAEATACNTIAPGVATIAVLSELSDYSAESLKLTMSAIGGERLLKDFGKNSVGTVTVDTSVLPEGTYPVTAILDYSYVDLNRAMLPQSVIIVLADTRY